MGLKVPAILVTESRTFTSIDLSQSRDDEETVDGVPTTFEAPKLSWRLVAKGFCGLPRTACMEAKPGRWSRLSFSPVSGDCMAGEGFGYRQVTTQSTSLGLLASRFHKQAQTVCGQAVKYQIVLKWKANAVNPNNSKRTFQSTIVAVYCVGATRKTPRLLFSIRQNIRIEGSLRSKA